MRAVGRMVEWLSLRRLCSEKTVCATEDEVRRSNRGTKLKNGGIRHPPDSRSGLRQLRAAPRQRNSHPLFWKGFGFASKFNS